MRISDWSSDVCSSDLHEIVIRQIGRAEPRPRASAHGGATRQRWRTLLTCFGWQLVCPENTITYLAQCSAAPCKRATCADSRVDKRLCSRCAGPHRSEERRGGQGGVRPGKVVGS